MTGDTITPSSGAEPEGVASAGARLHEARMAAGLSIDAVAQQLKLAPRQVRAMEEDDFAQLPGRTFIRGFVRNYARLLRLDVDAVLADLPEPELSPSLDRPSLAPTTRAMGEMPADLQPKRSASRWAIPLVLLAIIAAGIAYELTRPGSELALLLGVHRPGAERSGPVGASPTAVDPTPAVPLPNPIAPDSERGASNTAAPAGDGAAVPAAPVAAAAAPTEANADPALVLVFRATSWVEVKDGKGNILLSTIGYPGASHAIGGTPPIEVVLGNAEAVAVTWHGVAFDSTPHTRQNVAKFTLK